MKKIFIALLFFFIVSRLLIFITFNDHYMGGDAESYIKMAKHEAFTLSNYFSIKDSKLQSIRNYEFDSKDYPYLNINEVEFWEPGYPLFLKLMFFISIDEGHNLIKMLQHVFLLLSFYIWWLILKKYRLKKSHFIIIFIILVHPFFLAAPQLLYTEVFDTLIMSLIYFYHLKAKENWKDYLILGLLIGFFTITESYNLPLSLVYICYLLIQSAPLKNKVLLFLAYFIPMLPVFYHNYLHTDGGFLLSTKNSNNLWVSNNNLPILNFDMNESGWPLPSDYFGNEDKYSEVRKPCYVEYKKQAQCEAKHAIIFALKNPALFIQRAYQKYKNLWSPNLFPFNKGFNIHGIGLTEKNSVIVHNIFVVFEILFTITFFFSVSILIAGNIDKLSLTILLQLIYFHAILIFAHGMVRYRLGYMGILTAIIFIALSKLNPTTLLRKRFILSFCFFLIFYFSVLYEKASVVFLS
tara:strand:+ start:136322 stop:137716 length:1395 start_codon:yes stop_codon:yes gene_type:complete